MKNNYLLIFFTLISIAFNAQTKTIPYQELVAANGALSGSGVFFGATMSASSITLNFAGPSDRWIALGIGSNMSPADVLVYSNGKFGATHPLGWNDYYNSSGGSPGVNNDGSQDWTILSTGTVSPGQRTVTASRALSTGDANDAVITFSNTSLDLVWAFGATADYTIAYHGNNNRAYLISLPWLSVPSASFVSSSTVCVGSSIAYSNTSTGGQTSYTWNFSGGTPVISTATNPTITYTTPGTYSVALTASNVLGSNTYSVINYVTVTQTVTPSVSILLSSGSNPMCAGSSVSFSATPVNGGSNPSYQWQVNGVNVGTNSQLFTSNSLTNSATVVCVLNSNATCASPTTATSAAINMTVNSTAPASLSISQVMGSNPTCIGAVTGFSALPFNGGSSPGYQWMINGVNSGNNSPSFTVNSLSNADVITCLMTSNAPCTSSALALSSGITMSVSSVLVPGISLSTQNNPDCAGSIVSVTASPVNGGNSPQYQWLLNGSPVPASASVYTSNTLANGDVLTCQMTSALQCANPSTVMSISVIFTINPVPAMPTITASGPLSICAGNSVTLTSSAVNGNLWSNGITTQTLIASNTSSYSLVQTFNGCSSPVSSVVNVTVHPLPNAGLLVVNSLCKDAEAVQLLGIPPGGVYSGPGVLGSFFNPLTANTGSDNVVVYKYTDANNCSDTASIRVVVDECLSVIKDAKQPSQIKIYPNPGRGEFRIEAREEILSVRILDGSGKIARSYNELQATDLVVDLSTFPNAVYVFEIALKSSIVQLRVGKINP